MELNLKTCINMHYILKISALSVLIFASCTQSAEFSVLEEAFLNPPDAARPGVYWYFMDGSWKY
jgi:hypothetical protein